MDYILGSLVTLLIIFIVGKWVTRDSENLKKPITVRFNQSHSYELIKPIIPLIYKYKPLNTQASKFEQKHKVRVLLLEGSAYWIANNQVFTAPISEGGEVDQSNASAIDTMGMDKVQLDKIIFIVDKLTEGTHDDTSTSGN